ncbi:hypothetical protein DTO212C5_1131 [Paecilomyces variotii]|nr:hypothetical protein DTO212C5_1131 [Paecilomyces variotii]KAJ9354973.1 hypothetical protein DTO027B9_4386 [Paecilomyces variotii]
MASEQNEDVGLEERLKSALWLSIGKIVDEETIKLGVNATPQFIGALTEMVWAQIETVSQDLESFAKHAGRSTINVADVMLLTRRNEGLESILRAFVDQQLNGTPYTESDYAHDDYAINVRRMGWILTEYYYWLWLFRGTCGSTPCFQRPVLDEHTLTPVDFSGLTELVSSFHWLYKASTSTDVEVDDTSDAMIYIAFCGEI